MKACVLLTALATLFLASPDLRAVPNRPVKKDPVKADMKRMEGDWLVTSYVSEGQDPLKQGAFVMKRTIAGNRWTTIMNGQSRQYTFTIDPSKTPRTIDITIVGDGGEAKVMPCIYEVTGDTFKLCQAQPGRKRPTTFTAEAGSGVILTIAARQKQK